MKYVLTTLLILVSFFAGRYTSHIEINLSERTKIEIKSAWNDIKKRTKNIKIPDSMVEIDY